MSPTEVGMYRRTNFTQVNPDTVVPCMSLYIADFLLAGFKVYDRPSDLP